MSKGEPQMTGATQRDRGLRNLRQAEACGRGIRLARYIGRVKAMQQAELRWRAIGFEVADVPIDITLLGFLDAGFVATDWSSLDELGTPLLGEGGGLRIAVDQNFIVRADVGVSAIVDYAPSVYIDIRNTF